MKHHHTPSDHDPHHHHHGFDDVNAVAQRLDAPERDAWQKPDAVIASLQLPHDATVAEIGSGTGYFVVRLAQHLPHGTVIGLDTEPRMVEYLRQRAARLGLANLEARLVPPAAAIPIAEPVDLLLCADTYHHMPDRVAAFAGAIRHLKPGGKLVVIDRPLDAPEGPPADFRLPAERVAAELTQAGFHLEATHDFLLPYQYVLVFSAGDAASPPA